MCPLLMERSDEEEGIRDTILEGVEIFTLVAPMEFTVQGLLTPPLLAGVLGLRFAPEPLGVVRISAEGGLG